MRVWLSHSQVAAGHEIPRQMGERTYIIQLFYLEAEITSIMKTSIGVIVNKYLYLIEIVF